jgi:hypothetical protein
LPSPGNWRAITFRTSAPTSAEALSAQADADLASPTRVHWPFEQRPLADLFAWANTELTKSAAEIGYARFLYAVRA